MTVLLEEDKNETNGENIIVGDPIFKGIAFFVPPGPLPRKRKSESVAFQPGGTFLMTDSGFVVVWRKITQTSFYRDSYALHIAIHLIIKANHSPRKFLFNQKEETIYRGQVLTGRQSLSRETGIKPSTVRNKLLMLSKIGFCNIKSNSKFSIITILNYEAYQNYKSYIGHQRGQPEDSGRTARGQREDTNNNVNNENNVIRKNRGIVSPRFVKPTFEQVKEYCNQINTKIDPETFYHYYEGAGWIKANGQKVINWKSTIRTWEKRNLSKEEMRPKYQDPERRFKDTQEYLRKMESGEL